MFLFNKKPTFKQKFIQELKDKLFEAEVNQTALAEILPQMQETKESLQSQIDISNQFIGEMQKDPSYEARQKRQREEKQLKKWEEKMKKQNEEIDKTIQRNEDLEKTIDNLSIFIGVAEKMK